jgi:hypothetical protein
MKYLLILQGDAELGAPDHDRFRKVAHESGELITGHLLADPSTGLVIGTGIANRIRAYYLIDVDTLDRATHLAHLLREPDGLAVEIRPIMQPTAADY